MNLSIAFEPLLSWPLLAAVLAPIALLALVGLWLRQRGAIFRFAALLALVAALVNPVLLDEEREPLKSVVALIVDRSQSQDIGQRKQGERHEQGRQPWPGKQGLEGNGPVHGSAPVSR